MVVVAVAGGTGNVGRTLVEAIIATGKHDVKILGRKANPDLEKELGASIIVVDYTDIEATIRALEANNIHTVVSAIAMMVPGGVPPENELIRAADASKTTKRIISSDWGVPHKEEQRSQLPSVAHKLDAQAALKQTKDLEYTVIHNGYFLDYWCMPAVKSYMTPITLVVDAAYNTAAIPGSGNVPVAFTHTTDVAKYVAAVLDLEKWEPEFFIVGDKVTWNEFVHLAETAKGTKFKVDYDSIEKLKSGQITELPSQVPAYQFFPKEALQGMLSTFGLWFEEGRLDIPSSGKKSLNDLFPQIKPLTVKGALEAALKN